MEEIQEGLFVMKWRTFIPMMIGIILSTNTGSVFYQHQKHNTEQIKYNKERADRISRRHTNEIKSLMEIEHLKQELDDCIKEKNSSTN